MDKAFEGLPVWLVSDWGEVTDRAALKKSAEVRAMVRDGKYELDRLFTPWWERELRRVPEG